MLGPELASTWINQHQQQSATQLSSTAITTRPMCSSYSSVCLQVQDKLIIAWHVSEK